MKHPPTDMKLKPYPYAPPEARYNDPVAWTNYREQRVREIAIAIEMGKILKQRLAECYQTEGVNHLQNCKEEQRKYLEHIQKPNYGSLRGDEE